MGRHTNRKPVARVPDGGIGCNHGGHVKWETMGVFGPEHTRRIRRILRRGRPSPDFSGNFLETAITPTGEFIRHDAGFGLPNPACESVLPH